MPPFSTIEQLKSYINTNIDSNGSGSITGEKDNTALIGLSDFIVEYGLNTTMASIANDSGVLALTKPVTIVASLPASLQWPDNIQNQYYIVNTLGVNIPLTDGYSYFNEAMVEYDYIPALSTVQIVKASNGSWVRVNTATSGAVEVPNSATDNDAIKIVLGGTLNRNIQAVLEVSPDAGNAFEIRNNGAFAPASSGGGGSSFTGDFF